MDISNKKVITEYIFPPIPLRWSDWTAILDGYQPGDPMGVGSTEAAAIADLKEQLIDHELSKL